MSDGTHNVWPEYTVAEIADKNDRYSFTGGPFGSDLKRDDYVGQGVRIIQLQNIGDGEFLDSYKIYTTEEKADELSSSNIFPGDIIISKMGDPVARAAKMPSYSKRYVMASDGIRLSVDKNQFDVKYILDSINHIRFRRQAEENSTGTTRKRIGFSALRDLTIPVPPLPEQKKIATILTSVDTVIEKTHAQIVKLNDLKTSMMQELLTKGIGPDGKPHTEFKDSPVGRIPVGWECRTLETMLSKSKYPMRSGPFGSSLLKSELVKIGIPYLGIDNVHREHFSNNFKRHVTQEKFMELEKYRVFPNDVMITIMGTVGRSCVVPKSVGSALSSKLSLIHI